MTNFSSQRDTFSMSNVKPICDLTSWKQVFDDQCSGQKTQRIDVTCVTWKYIRNRICILVHPTQLSYIPFGWIVHIGGPSRSYILNSNHFISFNLIFKLHNTGFSPYYLLFSLCSGIGFENRSGIWILASSILVKKETHNPLSFFKMQILRFTR